VLARLRLAERFQDTEPFAGKPGGPYIPPYGDA
jgi:hypothetical protein